MQLFTMAAALLAGAILPTGTHLLYHHYSAYDTRDSQLFCYHASTQEQVELQDASFVHAMNGDFGSHCYDITFMAIDPLADEWDIFRYNTISRKLENLTERSGFRNEDPKFSPDGNSLVFKRGYWSHEENDFVYDLALMDLRTKDITMLTNGGGEESMPCFSPDGRTVYYAQSGNGETAICSLSLDTLETQCLYTESGVHAYYPMAAESGLYFSKWHSPTLRNDCIVRLTDGVPDLLPFNDTAYNCSDVFPCPDGGMLFSSSKDGSYDLYYFDGTQEFPLTSCNSQLQELGASCFTAQDTQIIVRETLDFLLCRGQSGKNMDANGDGVVDGFDLAMLKRMK